MSNLTGKSLPLLKPAWRWHTQAVKNATDTFIAPHPLGQTLVQAVAQVGAVAPGHFDELRAGALPVSGSMRKNAPDLPTDNPPFTQAWGHFFEHLAENGHPGLNQRAASLERQIRDNGVTYNVYADEGGPQRPWSLDLFR